jgi:hypothetical protein
MHMCVHACACMFVGGWIGMHLRVRHGLMVGSLMVRMLPPGVQEMTGCLLLTSSVVGCVTTRGVAGPCHVSFQFRAFHPLRHVTLAVSAKHKGSPLHLHVLIRCFSCYGFVFSLLINKGPFREQVYSKICDIWYWIIQKSLLASKLTKIFKLNKKGLTVLCWENAAAPCYINSGEKD